MASDPSAPESPAGRQLVLPGNVPDDCHATIREMVEYWLSLHPGEGLPGRQHFDPVDVPHMLPNLRLLDVVGDPPRFKTRLMGTRLREFFGSEHTGRWYDEIFPDFAGSATHTGLVTAFRTKEPQWRRGNPTLVYDKEFVVLERVFLPFAGDGRTVDLIVTLMLFGDEKGRFT